MKSTFHPAVTPPAAVPGPAYWLIFRGSELLVTADRECTSLPLLESAADLDLPILRRQYLGLLQTGDRELPCFTAETTADAQPPAGTIFHTLRQLFSRLDEPQLALAGRAIQIIDWDRTHTYCGSCGTPVEQLQHERAKRCPSCGLTNYPRLSPAMIVRVQRQGEQGPEILLARNHRHPLGFYSVLAGFVEPGESLEECVRREVCEEVSIEIENIRYFGSQPWPFPNSLMIAFTADYAAGSLELEEEEIADAGWFRPDSLPPVPPPISIARRLIDSFVDESRHKS
jgi:NAD+ diphosphatase